MFAFCGSSALFPSRRIGYQLTLIRTLLRLILLIVRILLILRATWRAGTVIPLFAQILATEACFILWGWNFRQNCNTLRMADFGLLRGQRVLPYPRILICDLADLWSFWFVILSSQPLVQASLATYSWSPSNLFWISHPPKEESSTSVCYAYVRILDKC